jgi:hypothetical protein
VNGAPRSEDAPRSDGTPPLTAREWFRRFRERYGRSAESPLTDLGLFYERHRRFVDYYHVSDPSYPEYADEHWDRVMASFLAAFSGEFGLIQAPDWKGGPSIDWFGPGAPEKVAVTIRRANSATDAILTRDLPEVIASSAELSVLVMYPDYPKPPGTQGIDEATLAWKGRMERALASLRPSREFLLLTISAYAWDLPPPWKGYVWVPQRSRLEEA